jgi:hypothetical protein
MNMQATQGPVATPTPPGVPLGGDPAAIYRALQNQGNVLREQLDNLADQRRELQQQYDQMSSANPGRAGIEKRMSAIDARMAEMDAQIAKSDQAIAAAAGIPGATVPPPRPPQSDNPDPDLVAGLSFVVIMIFAIPISIAYARRIWRRSARTEVVLHPQMMERLDSLERGMEAVALEVERIGEGQRFVTQALAGRAVGAGAAEPIAIPQGERLEQRR